jgi:two-component system, cell cycle sensor histidine kinase and response regulator CckA
VTQRWRVLIVDDEHTVRRVLERALAVDGYELLVAARADIALELVAEKAAVIDLAIIDVGLPEMGGVQLAKIMRRLQPGLPVLFISGDGPEAPPEALREHFLDKPFDLQGFAQCVRELLATGLCEACSPVNITRRA